MIVNDDSDSKATISDFDPTKPVQWSDPAIIRPDSPFAEEMRRLINTPIPIGSKRLDEIRNLCGKIRRSLEPEWNEEDPRQEDLKVAKRILGDFTIRNKADFVTPLLDAMYAEHDSTKDDVEQNIYHQYLIQMEKATNHPITKGTRHLSDCYEVLRYAMYASLNDRRGILPEQIEDIKKAIKHLRTARKVNGTNLAIAMLQR